MQGMPHDGARLVKRWIGARRRRASRKRGDAHGAGAEIITLTWAQTFGRGIASPEPGAVRDREGGRPGGVVGLGEGLPGS
ncbi:hypothetical protein DA075_24500 [Methylobacterium currus]|uniref:Uncharacterized protein n=1 Tax=Methylobacterium currus TaxID=2051553 RepID=A0A2R4WQ61_9HYPH|nr:hypothetical protein [Methylobacterium currus]AWB23661.1 hypothetical protein DA075_24500 [Methylobacterium currus]UHC16670.1 hypothetical protein LRS73_01680 [Methylobacterium currus]